jgi:hypothetical protein
MSLVNTLRKTLFVSSNNHNDQSDQSQMCFIKSRKAILKELEASKHSGTLVGVYCRALGEGMFLVGINNIESGSPSEIIVFESYDQSGVILGRTRISIDEIKMVSPFNKKYINPVLSKLQIV